MILFAFCLSRRHQRPSIYAAPAQPGRRPLLRVPQDNPARRAASNPREPETNIHHLWPLQSRLEPHRPLPDRPSDLNLTRVKPKWGLNVKTVPDYAEPLP